MKYYRGTLSKGYTGVADVFDMKKSIVLPNFSEISTKEINVEGTKDTHKGVRKSLEILLSTSHTHLQPPTRVLRSLQQAQNQ